MPLLKAKELRELPVDELNRQLTERSEALRSLRFQFITGSVDNVRAMRNTRRDIARIKTVLRERELQAEKEAS